jgi:hypothetical protein
MQFALLLLTAVASVLFFSPKTAAAPQPLGIASGRYPIGPAAIGGGSGSKIIPTYCLDVGLKTPTPDDVFTQILHGALGARLEMPNGKKIPLQEAINKGIVHFTGGPLKSSSFGFSDPQYEEMRVTGPPGSSIVAEEPFALSAQPSLQNSISHGISSDLWSKLSNEIKTPEGKADEDIQDQLWALRDDELDFPLEQEADFRQAFGDAGVAMLQSFHETSTVVNPQLSTLGKTPVLHFLAEPKGADEPQEYVMVKEGGKPAIHAVDPYQTENLDANLQAGLSPLLSPDTAFLVQTFDGRLLFINNANDKPSVVETDLLGDIRPDSNVHEWATEKDGVKPGLILLTETPDDIFLDTSSVQESLGKGVRIVEARNPELGIKNLRAIKPISSPKDLAVYWDTSLERAGFIPRMKPYFESAGILYYEGTEPSAAANLLVISGHKATSYRDYLTTLGEKGALKGKSLALLSCGAVSDSAFCSELILKYGVISVFRVNDTIEPSVLPSFLRALCSKAKSLPEGGIYLSDLVTDSVSEAQNDATEGLREDLDTILDSTVQVSQIQKRATLTEP